MNGGRSDRPAEDAELAAVLLALASARRGDLVAECGAGALVRRALLAMSSTTSCATSGARVVVAGGLDHLTEAASLLAPGGRLVSVATDEGAALAQAASVGVPFPHVVAVHEGVAWSGRLTSTSRPPG